MKFTKIFSWILIGITLVVMAIFFYETESLNNISMYLVWGYILLAIAIVLALGLPFLYIVQKPQMLKKTLLNTGALIAVLLVAYLIASNAPVTLFDGSISSTADSKLSDFCLYAMYILVGISILSLLAGSVRSMIRNR
jgi:hypothetical protein